MILLSSPSPSPGESVAPVSGNPTPTLHSLIFSSLSPTALVLVDGSGVVTVAMLTNSKGYEYITDSDGNPVVPHHRLLAVAQHGVDALDDERVTHHDLPVEWANFRGNVTMLTPTEHARVHADDDVVDDLDELIDDRDDGPREERE